MPRRRRVAVKDKWKLKKWYKVLAPPVFGNVVVGTTPADDPLKLIGRVMEVTLYDITGDPEQIYIMLYFQIIDVDEENLLAKTRLKRIELSRDYMKSLIRRKSSKITGIFNVATKDGYHLRITAVTLTSYRCKTSQKRAIRKIMQEIITTRIPEMTYDEAVQAMIFGQLSNEIAEKARKIYPVRKAVIYKSKLLMIPTPEGPKPAVVVSPYAQGKR